MSSNVADRGVGHAGVAIDGECGIRPFDILEVAAVVFGPGPGGGEVGGDAAEVQLQPLGGDAEAVGRFEHGAGIGNPLAHPAEHRQHRPHQKQRQRRGHQDFDERIAQRQRTAATTPDIRPIGPIHTSSPLTRSQALTCPRVARSPSMYIRPRVGGKVNRIRWLTPTEPPERGVKDAG